jgi:zinc/manganese transport system permease protein
MTHLPALGLAFATALPPFSLNLLQDAQVMLRYDFMRNAFLTGTAVALVAGLAGYFTLLRQLAFAGDALSHITFAGALGAALFSLNPLLGVFGLTAVVAVAIGALGERARARDEVVGVALAWTLGLGVLFSSLYTAGSGATNSALGVKTLFGSILGVQDAQAHVVALMAAGVTLILLLIARPLLFASIDPAVAATRGVPTRLLGVGFLVLLAITVGGATQVTGALLIFALLITPAATALRLTSRPFLGMALSSLLAVTITWAGLTITFYTALPASFLISALAFICYILAIAWRRLTQSLSGRRAIQSTGSATPPAPVSLAGE